MMLRPLIDGTRVATQYHKFHDCIIDIVKAAYSVTMNIFRKFLFSFKSFVKVELGYVFTIKMFSTAETAWKSEYLIK